MSYEAYYESHHERISLGEHTNAVLLAAKSLTKSVPDVFSPEPDRPMTFVLGGFHPYTSTPEDFLSICESLHSHPDDRHIFMDQNLTPLETVDTEERHFRVYQSYYGYDPKNYNQKRLGKLEEIDAWGKSDAIILDFTLHFMTDKQVREFAKSAEKSLERNGLVFVISDDPLSNLVSKIKNSLLNPVPYFPRHAAKTRKLLSSTLKQVYYADMKGELKRDYTIQVFARHDSDFPEDIDDPRGLETTEIY